MIAIITQNPAAGREIARVIGAHEKHSGYMQGGDYIVTWALGHLLELAPPESYGKRRGAETPFIPENFRYVKRDKAAARQLGVIRRVLSECESVIAATDASAEGELTFRRIYNFLGCNLPVKRLWISSLTEESIEQDMRNLRDGSDFDRLWFAADCRAKADWLVGVNANRALSRATDIPGDSLGRVQTPILAIIAARYLEHKHFRATPYWTLTVTLGSCGALRKFRAVQEFTTLAAAEGAENALRARPSAAVTRVERKTTPKSPPFIEATIGDMRFRTRYVRGLAVGDTLAVTGHSIAACRTLPAPLYTEATFLAAMEDVGLGTPATRAGIIETLLKRGYIERSGRALIPTERGLSLYESIRHLRIADVELTATWEKSLAAIERGDMKPETFMTAIEIYTRQITAEILALDTRRPSDEMPKCPKCGGGPVTLHHRLARCGGCGLIVQRRFLNVRLTDDQLTALLKDGATPVIEGFHGKADKTFAARLTFDKNFNLTFVPSEHKK